MTYGNPLGCGFLYGDNMSYQGDIVLYCKYSTSFYQTITVQNIVVLVEDPQEALRFHKTYLAEHYIKGMSIDKMRFVPILSPAVVPQ